MSARQGITHWCALMEPKLLRMLAAMAIHFKPLGPPVEYHGFRQPCYCHVGTVLNRVKRDRPMFWQILTDADPIQARSLPTGSHPTEKLRATFTLQLGSYRNIN